MNIGSFVPGFKDGKICPYCVMVWAGIFLAVFLAYRNWQLMKGNDDEG